MIRLLRMSLTRLGLAQSQANCFSGKKLFKNAKSNNSPPLRNDQEKRQDKHESIRSQPFGDNAQEMDKKWQTQSAGRSFFPPIQSLLTKSQLQLIESKLAPPQTTTLRQKLATLNSEKKSHQKAFAEFQMLRIMIPGLIAAQLELSQELLRYILERYYCSYFLMTYSNDHAQDSVSLEILDKYKTGVEEYLKTAYIKHKLRFLYLLKGLATRRMHFSAYRPVIQHYNAFFYPLIEADFQATDFSGWNGSMLLQIFAKIVDEHLLISNDSRLIDAVCSQVPFFSPNNILKFMLDFPGIVEKAEKGTLMAVLEVLELDRFSETQPKQYLGYIDAFGRLTRSHAQVSNKIQHLFHLLLSHLLEKRSKDGNIAQPRGLLLELITEISKQITLEGQSQQARILFTYFRFLIDGLPRLSNEDFHRECKVLFEILTIVTDNSFLRRSTFEKEFATLESHLQRVASKRSQVRSAYLWKFLKNKSQKLEICNAGWLLELSSHKQANLVEQIAATDDPELAKSLMLMLVDAQRKEAPLLSLRALLPEFTFQQILTRLNRNLLRLDIPQTLLAIFSEVVMRQDFNELAIQLLQNLHSLPEVDSKQILQLFIKSILLRISGRGVKKVLASFLLVLQFYINTLKQVKSMLSCPGFYYLLSRMLSFQASTSDLSEFNINIYRILLFIFDQSNSPYIVDSLIEHSLRNFGFPPEVLERLKQFIAVYVLERQIILFKLDHVVPASEVEAIFGKMQRYSRASVRHRALINKLHDPAYLPEGPLNEDNLVVFLLDQNGPTLLQPHLQTTKEIISKSTVKQLAILLYNCKVSPKMVQSEIFAFLWQTFLDRLQDPRQILCTYLLQKYGKAISHQQSMQLLAKIFEFYTNNLDLFLPAQHFFLLQFIKNHFIRKDLPHDAKQYVQNMHQYLLESNFNAINYSRTKILNLILSLGFPLRQDQLREVRPRMFEEQLSFYTLIAHEDVFGPQKMQDMLKEYLKHRAKMKQLDLSEVDHYIKLKYPSLSGFLSVPEGSKMPFHLKQHCERQYNIMNRLQKRYKDLFFKDKSFFFTNKQHLLAFCLKQHRHYVQFKLKYFAVQPTISHLKAHIFDFSDIDQPNFFERLQAQGIVSAPAKQKVTASEASSAEKLAQQIASKSKQKQKAQPDSTKN